MNKRITAVCALSLVLFAGCSAEKEPHMAATFSEVTTTVATTSSETSATVQEGFSYMDHALFMGDRLCESLSLSGLVNADNIVVSGLDAASFAGSAADSVPDGYSYVYISLGEADISLGSNPEQYAASLLQAAKDIRAKHPSVTVVLLGNPPLKEEIGYKTIYYDDGTEKTVKLDTTAVRYNKAIYDAVEAETDLGIHFIDICVSLADMDGVLSEKSDSGDGRLISSDGVSAVLSLLDSNRYADTITWNDRYMYMYPDVMSPGRPDYTVTDGKVAYLTFDDGPSKYTPEILDILDRNGIKATFFVTGWTIEGKEDTLRREVEEGHVIGLHSWTHDYDYIYSSTNDYMDDFAMVFYKVEEITGKAPWAFRFPGGSYNNHNKLTADRIIKEMNRRGFEYYDWNCATSDAVGGSTYESCIEEMKKTTTADHSVLLMHDAVEYTPQYLQEVIDYLRGEGYSFETIETADPSHFKH